MSKPYLFFGREPVLWLSLAAVTIQFVNAFLVHVTPHQQAGINAALAAIVGVLIARFVHDGVNAAILGLVQALLGLGIAYGLHLDAEHQALLMSLATAALAMFTRTQVSAPVTKADLTQAA